MQDLFVRSNTCGHIAVKNLSGLPKAPVPRGKREVREKRNNFDHHIDRHSLERNEQGCSVLFRMVVSPTSVIDQKHTFYPRPFGRRVGKEPSNSSLVLQLVIIFSGDRV